MKPEVKEPIPAWILELIKKYPNDQDLGKKVREKLNQNR